MASLFSNWRQRAEYKQLRQFISFAWKRLRRDHDILPAKHELALRCELQRAQNAVDAKEADLSGVNESLMKSYDRCFPVHPSASWRENGEVILVALVVAMAVRAFFLQPFKIPTGSMQPTLNGITVHGVKPYQKTLWYRCVAFPVFGEHILHYEAETDGEFVSIRSVKIGPLHYGGRNGFSNLLPTDATEFVVGETHYWIPIDPRKFSEEVLRIQDPSSPPLLDRTRFFKKGETILDCVVQTGDQLFVDRFTYNFRKPKRGEVFVFETTGLPVPSPGEFYIKRLAGLPGDTLQIKGSDLFLNQEKVTEPIGFRRVMSKENGYHGYTNEISRDGSLKEPRTLGDRQYFALGDNSYHSSDSRDWGVVPYQNIVGRGFFVFWPFTSHLGRIE